MCGRKNVDDNDNDHVFCVYASHYFDFIFTECAG